MTPHMEAIAFRIWQVAEPKGWDLTVGEASRRAGVPTKSAIHAVKQKGWRTRFRANQYDYRYVPGGRPMGAMIHALGWDQ